MFKNKNLLITGGTGSFGNAVLRRFLDSDIAEIRIFSRDEKKQDDMRKRYNHPKLKFYIGDVRDERSVSGAMRGVDYVFHAAALKQVPSCEFHPMQAVRTNVLGTENVLEAAIAAGAKRVVCLSTDKAVYPINAMGISKAMMEKVMVAASRNLEGTRGLPIQVNDLEASVTLVYVDDVMKRFMQIMDGADAAVDAVGFATISPQYTTTVGELARQFQVFKDSRVTLMTERVGTGLMRALYATYVSYLPVELFAYTVPQHADPRGVFVEMLKTPDCGQFSHFTAHPGTTRGGHYHHSKTEKFLVIKGRARFKFRHMQTGQCHELVTTSEKAEVVETVPGWTHDITNIGSDEMVVMLWANEVFDRLKPDTFACPL